MSRPPSHSQSNQTVDPQLHDDLQPHDDTRRRRLRLRLSVATQETIRSFASVRGVSEAGLLDALLHGLEVADKDWLNGVADQARRIDAYYQNAGMPTSTNDTSRA